MNENDSKEKELEKLKNRLDDIQKEEQIKQKEKLEKDEQYIEELNNNEEKRIVDEKERKKIKEEEKKLQAIFSDKVGTNIEKSKKLIGFIKRYVLIGIVTGIPGIGLTYLWDKWQENKMIKNLYNKNIESVSNSNNKELAKEYELLRKKFYKAYDIDKIERLLMESDEIEKLKNSQKSLKVLNAEIKECRELYEKNLDNYIENQILEERQEGIEEITVERENEEELEIR